MNTMFRRLAAMCVVATVPSFYRSRTVTAIDLDGTLIVTSKNDDIQFTPFYGDRYIKFRPLARAFVRFVNFFSTPVIYTASSGSYPGRAVDALNIGRQIDHIYDRQYCTGENRKKDLTVVAEDYQVPLQNVLLIDDLPRSFVKGQRFVHVNSYTGKSFDTELIRVAIQVYIHAWRGIFV